MKKTKIVCTLGPATDNDEVLRELIKNGMDCARFNFSHGDYESHKARYEQVKRIREELGVPIPIILDTKGPEVRVKSFKDGKNAELKKGNEFTLTTRETEGDDTVVSITYKNLADDIQTGAKILIDDGLLELKVTEIDRKEDYDDIRCKVIHGGTLKPNKSCNFPGIHFSMPYLSEKDKNDLLFGIKTGFDIVAASFVTSDDDIIQIRKFLDENGGKHIKIIAKIENQDGVNNIEDILRVADGIMVARGDMGVEIPFEEIPRIQKELIHKGYNAGKQVITATQMLDSMIKNPRPTRAETTDVANAIYDGTSAIMLSGETAAGAYPVEAVRTMKAIAETTEKDIDYRKRFYARDADKIPNVTNAIAHATVTTAIDLGATAILTVTKGGGTAKTLSKYRPTCPIIAATTSEVAQRQLNLSWGVIPIKAEEMSDSDSLFNHAVQRSMDEGLLNGGDLIVITAGLPLGISGTTNMMKVHIVGDVLVKGKGVTSKTATAPVCVCKEEDEAIKRFRSGDILVIPKTSNKIMSVLKSAAGIIVEDPNPDCHAAVVGLSLDIPVIYGAENAASILKSGVTITIEADRGLVCSSNN
ncbi:MAG: pyruvate kinase [Ruminococcaceae bacterium]|nr:pyruvate kinase [Oscillospiraceae bacterium]